MFICIEAFADKYCAIRVRAIFYTFRSFAIFGSIPLNIVLGFVGGAWWMLNYEH